MKDMLEKVLSSCEEVMKNPKYLNIDYNKLNLFIDSIDYDNVKHWLSDNPYGLLELDIADIVNFLLIFEAIDYSFWGEPKWTIQTELGPKDGSDALLYALLKYVKDAKTTDFSSISLDDFKSILEGNVEIPLLEERYKTVVEVSNVVNSAMNGNFYEYIRNVTSDKELLEIIINYFPSFKDEREYNGKTVYFYKLAQLLVSDILHLRERIEKIDVDYSNLLGCADYKIPQTLRALEIVSYGDKLTEIIDNKIEVEPSSEIEVEIRASMIVVINYIKNKLRNVNAIDINDYLFVFSKKVKEKARPYHLCRNTNY